MYGSWLLRLLITGVALFAPGVGASGETGPAAGMDTTCDIVAREDSDALWMQGVVIAQNARDGVYEFEVRTLGGSGGSAIRQSGQFSAASGEPEYVGSVQFGPSGAEYDARLTLRFDGGELVCTKRIGKDSAG
jgi:hypothetical protein